jgi:hypothetical protein
MSSTSKETTDYTALDTKEEITTNHRKFFVALSEGKKE